MGGGEGLGVWRILRNMLRHTSHALQYRGGGVGVEGRREEEKT